MSHAGQVLLRELKPDGDEQDWFVCSLDETVSTRDGCFSGVTLDGEFDSLMERFLDAAETLGPHDPALNYMTRIYQDGTIAFAIRPGDELEYIEDPDWPTNTGDLEMRCKAVRGAVHLLTQSRRREPVLYVRKDAKTGRVKASCRKPSSRGPGKRGQGVRSIDIAGCQFVRCALNQNIAQTKPEVRVDRLEFDLMVGPCGFPLRTGRIYGAAFLTGDVRGGLIEIEDDGRIRGHIGSDVLDIGPSDIFGRKLLDRENVTIWTNDFRSSAAYTPTVKRRIASSSTHRDSPQASFEGAI